MLGMTVRSYHFEEMREDEARHGANHCSQIDNCIPSLHTLAFSCLLGTCRYMYIMFTLVFRSGATFLAS